MRTLPAWVEVDLDALASNLRLVRGIVGPRVRIHLVVKADAYGHGAVPVARVAEDEGCHSVGVATLPDVAATAEELIQAADEAMYWVKSHGKNGIHVAGA